MDEIEKCEVVDVPTFRGRQMKSFEKVNSNPADWVACEIKDITQEGIIIFELPHNYETVTPYSDISNEKETTSFKKTQHSISLSIDENCELCGHSIKNLWFIQNDKDKLIMQVGSECVTNFKGAEYCKKVVKTYKENQVRLEFEQWKPLALKECEKHRSKTCGFTYDGEPILEYEWYKLKQKILTTIPEQTTSRKLKNLIKKVGIGE